LGEVHIPEIVSLDFRADPVPTERGQADQALLTRSIAMRRTSSTVAIATQLGK